MTKAIVGRLKHPTRCRDASGSAPEWLHCFIQLANGALFHPHDQWQFSGTVRAVEDGETPHRATLPPNCPQREVMQSNTSSIDERLGEWQVVTATTPAHTSPFLEDNANFANRVPIAVAQLTSESGSLDDSELALELRNHPEYCAESAPEVNHLANMVGSRERSPASMGLAEEDNTEEVEGTEVENEETLCEAEDPVFEVTKAANDSPLGVVDDDFVDEHLLSPEEQNDPPRVPEEGEEDATLANNEQMEETQTGFPRLNRTEKLLEEWSPLYHHMEAEQAVTFPRLLPGESIAQLCKLVHGKTFVFDHE